jgi:hypothetical protein
MTYGRGFFGRRRGTLNMLFSMGWDRISCQRGVGLFVARSGDVKVLKTYINKE